MGYEMEGAWGAIRPICGCHGDEEIEMTIQEGPHSLFYACPKYHPENRAPGERACANRINLIEYQKMVEKLTSELAEAEANHGSADLTNWKWKERGTEFAVTKHEKGKVTVSITNKRALK